MGESGRVHTREEYDCQAEVVDQFRFAGSDWGTARRARRVDWLALAFSGRLVCVKRTLVCLPTDDYCLSNLRR